MINFLGQKHVILQHLRDHEDAHEVVVSVPALDEEIDVLPLVGLGVKDGQAEHLSPGRGRDVIVGAPPHVDPVPGDEGEPVAGPDRWDLMQQGQIS